MSVGAVGVDRDAGVGPVRVGVSTGLLGVERLQHLPDS